MGVCTRPDVYMLMKSGQGWQPTSDYSSVVQQGKDRLTVPRGSLAEVADRTKNIAAHSSIQVGILDQKNMKMVPLVSDLRQVAVKGDQTYQLLRGVADLEKRYSVVTSGQLDQLAHLAKGVVVLYEDSYTEDFVPGVVRFLGQSPEGEPGWVVGLEIKKSDWAFGHTCGEYNGKQYFDQLCQEEKGIFCDISKVKFVERSCDNTSTLNKPQYHANNYSSEIRGSWSQELNKINNNNTNKFNMKNNGKTVNSILEKLGNFSSNLIQDKETDKLHNRLQHVNTDEFERDSKPGLRRKHSFSSSERPTSRSSSSGPHSRPGSRVQGCYLAEGDQDHARYQHSNKNSNTLNSDSFSWNPNSGGRKDPSRPPRKSPSPKFHSSLSGSTSTNSSSSGSAPAKGHLRSSGSSLEHRRSSLEHRKVSKKHEEERKNSDHSSSSSSDRKYQPALFDPTNPSEGRSTESTTETDSTLGFGRSWDEISKETGYSLLEFQDGRAKTPRDHSYSDLVRNMLTTNQHQHMGNERNWSSNSRREDMSEISHSRREDMSEMSLDLPETQADSDELTLPFGATLSRQSDNIHPDSLHSDNLILWEQEDVPGEDWQVDRSSHNFHHHTDIPHRYDYDHNIRSLSPVRRSEDRGLISPADDRSETRQLRADSAAGGNRVRSRQAGHRTAPFHRTGSSFGRKTPVPIFDSEDDTRRRLSEEEEEEEERGRGANQGGHEDRQPSWSQVLKKSSRDNDLRSGEEDQELLPEIDRPGSSKDQVAQFDQLVPDWLRKDLDQVVTGSMVQLEQSGQPLFGVVRWRGSMVGDNVEVVGADSGDLVGVELEEQVPAGGNGTLKGKSLFTCAEGKGVFVPVTYVRPDPRFTESVAQPGTSSSTPNGGSGGSIQEFGGHDCPTEPGVYPPHPPVEDVKTIAGRNKGIQGHQNSCYLDATLFSMFTFSSVFDSLLYRPRNKDDIPQYEEVQRVLRDEIVNPLRNKLFVRADRVLTLRGLLDNLSSVSGLMDQEKDPEEFLNSLLNQVLKASPYLELTSGQTSHTYQLFVEKDPSLKIPTVQELFEQSFLTSGIKFKKVPPILILQMPRFGTQFKMYERIIPSLLLDITDVIEGMPRQCTSCGQVATIECLKCYGDREQGLQSTAFCSSCYPRLHHNHQTRGNHHPTRLYGPLGRKREDKLTRVCMQLVAVICIETSHYVSFVRCGDTVKAPWAFFDSMADRKGEQNGYNIPELISVREVDYILSERGAAQLRSEPDLPLTEHARRLVSDSYICIYQSDEVRMYD